MNPEQNQQFQVTLRRHPFGIVALYLQAVFGIGIGIGLLMFLIPSLLTDDAKTQAMHYLSIFSIVAIILTALFLLLATTIYQQNRWIITNDSVTQILQMGLFKRQTSELSMANIEDVTAEQNGLLAELFGFGTLKAETAGERSNFHFLYCPRPNYYAKIILEARENYIQGDPVAAKRANDLLDVPRQPMV